MTECIFCRIVAGEIPSQKVYEDNEIFAFRDLHPQAPDHVLIIPKIHVTKLVDVSGSDESLMGKLIVATVEIAKRLDMDRKGFRVVVNNGESAGQSVWHLHVHLLSGRPFEWPPG